MAKEDGIIFELAESTLASDIPSGQTIEEPDIGPRIIQVNSLNPEQTIFKQTPLKDCIIDDKFKEDIEEKTYVSGWCWAFVKLWGDT